MSEPFPFLKAFTSASEISASQVETSSLQIPGSDIGFCSSHALKMALRRFPQPNHDLTGPKWLQQSDRY